MSLRVWNYQSSMAEGPLRISLSALLNSTRSSMLRSIFLTLLADHPHHRASLMAARRSRRAKPRATALDGASPHSPHRDLRQATPLHFVVDESLAITAAEFSGQ